MPSSRISCRMAARKPRRSQMTCHVANRFAQCSHACSSSPSANSSEALEAEHARRERRTDRRGVGRVCQGLEHEPHLARLVRVEHARVAVKDARYVGERSARWTVTCFRVRAREHGEVPRLERARPSGRALQRRARARGFARSRSRRAGGSVSVRRGRPSLLPLRREWSRHDHDLETARAAAPFTRRRSSAPFGVPTGSKRMSSSRNGEGTREKHRVHGVHERRVRAMIRAERGARIGVRRGAEIREHVGAAEGVDRLLRIADEKQARRSARGKCVRKISYWTGSVSWNSSISAAGKRRRTAAASARPRGPRRARPERVNHVVERLRRSAPGCASAARSRTCEREFALDATVPRRRALLDPMARVDQVVAERRTGDASGRCCPS